MLATPSARGAASGRVTVSASAMAGFMPWRRQVNANPIHGQRSRIPSSRRIAAATRPSGARRDARRRSASPRSWRPPSRRARRPRSRPPRPRHRSSAPSSRGDPSPSPERAACRARAARNLGRHQVDLLRGDARRMKNGPPRSSNRSGASSRPASSRTSSAARRRSASVPTSPARAPPRPAPRGGGTRTPAGPALPAPEDAAGRGRSASSTSIPAGPRAHRHRHRVRLGRSTTSMGYSAERDPSSAGCERGSA